VEKEDDPTKNEYESRQTQGSAHAVRARLGRRCGSLGEGNTETGAAITRNDPPHRTKKTILRGPLTDEQRRKKGEGVPTLGGPQSTSHTPGEIVRHGHERG